MAWQFLVRKTISITGMSCEKNNHCKPYRGRKENQIRAIIPTLLRCATNKAALNTCIVFCFFGCMASHHIQAHEVYQDAGGTTPADIEPVAYFGHGNAFVFGKVF